MAWQFDATHSMTVTSFFGESCDPEKAKCPTDFLWVVGVAHRRKADRRVKEGVPLYWMHNESAGQEHEAMISCGSGMKTLSLGLSLRMNP